MKYNTRRIVKCNVNKASQLIALNKIFKVHGKSCQIKRSYALCRSKVNKIRQIEQSCSSMQGNYIRFFFLPENEDTMKMSSNWMDIWSALHLCIVNKPSLFLCIQQTLHALVMILGWCPWLLWRVKSQRENVRTAVDLRRIWRTRWHAQWHKKPYLKFSC